MKTISHLYFKSQGVYPLINSREAESRNGYKEFIIVFDHQPISKKDTSVNNNWAALFLFAGHNESFTQLCVFLNSRLFFKIFHLKAINKNILI